MISRTASDALDDTHAMPRTFTVPPHDTPEATSSTGTLTSRTASDTLNDTRFVTLKLPYDDAVHYAIAECQEWLRERDTSAAGYEADAEWGSLNHNKSKAWYQGYHDGVRIDQAIRWFFRVMHESFAHNPYGLGARWYWFIITAMLTFGLGNTANGLVKASGLSRPTLGGQMFEGLQGLCAALPIAWMMPTFLFPALIANIDQQYAAMGVKIEKD